MGPIFAVLVSLWREGRNDRQNRRYYIFRTLMATRKIAMSREQVDALNLDEVRQDHLARVLHHMSVAMRMPLGEARLRSSGYSPRGWTVRNEIEQYLHDVAMNKASIPMRMVGAPSRPAE